MQNEKQCLVYGTKWLGEIRYEAILEQTKKEEKNGESPISVLFPPFDPDSKEFDKMKNEESWFNEEED